VRPPAGQQATLWAGSRPRLARRSCSEFWERKKPKLAPGCCSADWVCGGRSAVAAVDAPRFASLSTWLGLCVRSAGGRASKVRVEIYRRGNGCNILEYCTVHDSQDCWADCGRAWRKTRRVDGYSTLALPMGGSIGYEGNI